VLEVAMRIVLGIILGFFLTLGIAYVADYGHHGVCPTAEDRPLVNWDEVSLRYKNLSAAVESGWHKLVGH
jgi:hypothetical protein